MGSLENRLRRKWQHQSGEKAAYAENSFYEVFENLFRDTELVLIRKPKIFKKIYVDMPLDAEEMAEIYVPEKRIEYHGIIPDALILNQKTGKEIYVEIKRQDGWVENKERKAGRGNVHERFCKYFTPGLLRMMRETSGITSPHYPFWIIFQGDITRDICHVKEIRFWFDGVKENVTFWRDARNPDALINHFFQYILPLLE